MIDSPNLSERDRYGPTTASTLGRGGTLSSRELVWVSEFGDLDVSGCAPADPAWMAEALDSINGLLQSGPDWDSYGSPAIEPAVASRAVALLRWLAWTSTPAPRVIGTSHGGMQLEWLHGGQELQIEIDPADGVSVFYADRQQNSSWEVPLGSEPEGVDKLLYRMTLD